MADVLQLVPTRIPAVQVSENGRRVWIVRLLGDDGEDIKLDDPDVVGSGYSDGQDPNSATIEVKLVARDDIQANGAHFVTPGKILEKGDDCYEEDATLVRFTLEPSETMRNGIYEGQVGLFSGGKLVKTWPVFVEIEPNLFAGPSQASGLTVWWVKAAIRDLVPSDESLLDEIEFANYEVMHAMRRAVDEFNSALPHISTRYTTENFPWREGLLNGVIYHLYEMASKLYLRDHLPYSAGGTTINDKDKYGQYAAKAAEHRDMWQPWVKATKDKINSASFWGTVG